MTDLLFVYGTLMQQAANPFSEHLRQHSRYIGRGSFPGQLYLVSWYPGAVSDPAALTNVCGEVFQLLQPDLTLPLLDEYEDTAGDTGEFVRKPVTVSVVGQQKRCWVYLYNFSVEKLVHIPTGDFRPYLKGEL